MEKSIFDELDELLESLRDMKRRIEGLEQNEVISENLGKKFQATVESTEDGGGAIIKVPKRFIGKVANIEIE